MAEDKNVRDPKRHLRHVETRRQEVSIPAEDRERAKQAITERTGLEFSAEQLAILYLCQRGRQSLLDIWRGVNSTRMPVGKEPLEEKDILSLLKELEKQGYLTTAEIGGQATWTATNKAKELEI
jgi:hypothetical protein